MDSFYRNMLKTQERGSKLSFENVFRKEADSSMLTLPHEEHGCVPFNYYPFILNQKEHDLNFGIRIIEDEEYTKDVKSKVHLPENTVTHMDSVQKKAANEYVLEIEKNLNLSQLSNISFLDIGGGNGSLILLIARTILMKYPYLKMECSLLNSNPMMIEEAKKTFKTFSKMHQVNFTVYDINKQVRKEYGADVVISQTMLHHLEFPKEAVEQMTKYAKKLLIVRDLSRPPVLLFNQVAEEQGKNYSGEMKELFMNSLMSSMSYPEFFSMTQELKAVVYIIEPMYQVLVIKK